MTTRTRTTAAILPTLAAAFALQLAVPSAAHTPTVEAARSIIQVRPGPVDSDGVQGPAFIRTWTQVALPKRLVVHLAHNGDGGFVRLKRVTVSILSDTGAVTFEGEGPRVTSDNQRVGGRAWTPVPLAMIPAAVRDAVRDRYAADRAELTDALEHAVELELE